MSPDKLATMANQIAKFMSSKPHEEAVQGLADHISNFWEPRMRARLFAMIESGHEGLHPLVVEAKDRIRTVKAGVT